MDTLRICPNCRKPLPPDVPLGLCPECLIKSGFPTEGGTGVAGEAAGARFVPPPVEEIAQLFPQLEILSLIGKGGMGAVYKARQPMLDRFIALKVLPPAVAGDPGFAERFTREARALAKLNHPNIVAVYDFGKAGSLHYLLMEFVDGTNLRQVEQARKLSPEQAVTIVPKICEALQYAHDLGVVHRDIKPENILLDKSGRVKIADFGIAKMIGQGPTEVSLTGAKDVVGTPHYMAPEQIEKPQEVDHRADIYSLGVVFYEMLTGELPLGKFAAPSTKVQVDVRLDEVVLHTLEKEPSRRYQHVSEVKSDVETITGAGGSAGKTGVFAGQGTSEKVLLPALLLAFPFGLFGAHRFYVGKIGTAFTQLGAFIACIVLIIDNATGAQQPEAGLLLAFVALGCFIWATMDWILILCKVFTDGQGRRMTHWLHPQDGVAKTSVSSIAGPPPGPPSGPPPGGVPPVAGAGSPVPPVGPTAAPAVSTGIIVAPALALLITASLKLAVTLGSFAPEHWGRVPGFSAVIFMVIPALGALWGAFCMLRLSSYCWAIAGAVMAILAPPWHLLGVPVGIWALIVLARQDVREEFARASALSSPRGGPWPWLVAAGLGLVLVVICIMAAVSLVHDIVTEKPAVGGMPAGIVDVDKTSGPSEPESAVPPAAPMVAQPASTSGFPPIRIKAGASRSIVDHNGNLWLSDRGFAGGETTARPDLAIVNTEDPEIYRSERYGMNSFSYPVPNGKYQVKLHFSETYEDITGPGKRVFTFIVEGHEFKDFDVWAEAGGAQRALVKTVDVEVTDDRLNIYFVPERQNPQINGIEILPLPPPVVPTITPQPAGNNPSVMLNISSPSGRVVIAVTNGTSSSDQVQIKTDNTELTVAASKSELATSTTPANPLVPPAPAAPSPSATPEMPTPAKSSGTWHQPSAPREKIIRDLSTTDPYRQDYNKTLPLSAHGRIQLDNVNGHIEIAGWNRNEVVIKALKHGKTQESVEAVKIDVNSSSNKIVIHTVQPSNVTGSSWFGFGSRENKASVDYLLQVPQQAHLGKIDSVNGDIVIDGVSGDTETSSVNGSVRVRGAADNLKVSTVNGRMDVELASLGSDQIVSLDSVNGAIQAMLPANASARVTADTLNGGLSSEFPELAVKKQFPVSKHLKGTLGNGSATVTANTVNGSIRFQQGR